MTNKAPGTVARSKGIGGSEVGTLCGLNKYRTPYELYLLKRKQLPEDNTDDERRRFGRRLEKPIADEFAFRTGRPIKRAPHTFRHPLHRHLLANVDRLQWRNGEPGVYEGKNVDWHLRRTWTDGGVPEVYYLQLQHYLLVTGYNYGSFGVLFGGNEFHSFDVERDQSTIDQLLALEMDFWQRVQEGRPPDFSFGEAGAALVKRMYALAIPKTSIILDTPEAEGKLRRLFQLKGAIKAREAELLDLESWIKLQMGTADHGVFPGVAKIGWGNVPRRYVDLERLRKEHATLVAKYEEERISRRFTVTNLTDDPVPEDVDTDSPPIIITTGVRQIELPD